MKLFTSGPSKNKWQSWEQNPNPRVIPNHRLNAALQNPSHRQQNNSGLITDRPVCSDLFDSSSPTCASTFIHRAHYGVWSPPLEICTSLHSINICSHLSHVLLHQLRSNHPDEAGIGPVRNSAGTERFACTRWPKQKYSFGRLNPKVNKPFRL